MTSLHLRPVQFVDSPIGRDGEVARLAGGMQWFAAYDVIEDGARRTVSGRRFRRALGGDERAARLHAAITAPRAPLTLGERMLRFDQPSVAGILNVTPDSFSDGGAHVDDPAGAAAAGFDMAAAGAALIDVGGESTRPGAPTVWEGDEIARVVPVIERLARGGALVSIDTRKAAVMEAALAAGAAIVNDVSALLWDDRALDVVARAGCPVDPDALARSREGAARRRRLRRRRDSTCSTGWRRGSRRSSRAGSIGRGSSSIPASASASRCRTISRCSTSWRIFHGLGCPIMLGASRKRLIGALSNEAPVDRAARRIDRAGAEGRGGGRAAAARPRRRRDGAGAAGLARAARSGAGRVRSMRPCALRRSGGLMKGDDA